MRKLSVGWVRLNKCFYGTHIKTQCTIPYVITGFDEGRFDKMSHWSNITYLLLDFIIFFKKTMELIPINGLGSFDVGIS